MAQATSVNTAVRPDASSREYSTPGQLQPQYTVTLRVRGDASLTSNGENIFPIVAALPERYNIEFSSQWGAPFSGTNVSDMISQGARFASGSETVGRAVKWGAEKVAGATGVSTKVRSQSVQIWENSSPLAFSLDLIFHAKTNSVTDVKDKHRALLKLAAPSQWGPGGEILIQPGPIIMDQVVNEKSRKISMQIGTYLFLDNVVIKGVGSDVETLCDEAGIPMSMSINIQVESFYQSFTTQDIDKMFGYEPVMGGET